MELFALTTTTPKPTTTKYSADAQWSDTVNIVVPIVTMLVFVLAEALIYYVDDPGLRAKKRGKRDPDDYSDVEEETPTRIIVTTNFSSPPARDVQVASWQNQNQRADQGAKASEAASPQPVLVNETRNEASVTVDVTPEHSSPSSSSRSSSSPSPSTSHDTIEKAPDDVVVDPQPQAQAQAQAQARQSTSDLSKVDI